MYEHCRHEKDGYVLRVVQDECPFDPRREFDHVGHVICWHKRYSLSDEGLNKRFPTSEDFREWRDQQEDIVCLNLYMYDHSGLAFSLTPFSCPWDSGQIGYVYTTREDFERNGLDWDPAFAEKILADEVREFDDVHQGNVWGFVVEDRNGNHLESCWGFIGDPKWCEQEGLAMLEYVSKEAQDACI